MTGLLEELDLLADIACRAELHVRKLEADIAKKPQANEGNLPPTYSNPWWKRA